MTKQQALQKAGNLWGRHKAAVKDYGPKHPSSPEIREAASAALKAHREAFPNPKSGTPERKERDNMLWKATHYRYMVGYVNSLGMFSFFSVQGQGDTWEEAFAAATKQTAWEQGKVT